MAKGEYKGDFPVCLCEERSDEAISINVGATLEVARFLTRDSGISAFAAGKPPAFAAVKLNAFAAGNTTRLCCKQ